MHKKNPRKLVGYHTCTQLHMCTQMPTCTQAPTCTVKHGGHLLQLSFLVARAHDLEFCLCATHITPPCAVHTFESLCAVRVGWNFLSRRERQFYGCSMILLERENLRYEASNLLRWSRPLRKTLLVSTMVRAEHFWRSLLLRCPSPSG